jgi:hypothetical protein
MDGTKPESEARQKQRIKKAVKEQAIVMSNVKMLMLAAWFKDKEVFILIWNVLMPTVRIFFLVGKREEHHGFPC